MKKIVIFLSCFMVIPVFAEYINENTQLQWNSKVIENALDNAGFINSGAANWDVRTTRNRILEDLLTRQKFSVIDAIKVCKEKCNMSDFLRNGRGQSGKKCPELCESFANNMIKVNNEQNASIPKVSTTSDKFSNLQGKAVDVCRRLMSDATKNGISYPVLCGGKCDYFGQDKVRITDLVKTKEYEVDDFCDGEESGREYFYILSDAKNTEDVSYKSEGGRIAALKEAQTKPAEDYMKEEKRRKDEQRVAPHKQAYSKALESHGYCMEGQFVALHNSNCQKGARKYAQKCRCKLRSYVTGYVLPFNSDRYEVGTCYVNREANKRSSDSYHEEYKKYEYVPTYEECVNTFNESVCGAGAVYDSDCFEKEFSYYD